MHWGNPAGAPRTYTTHPLYRAEPDIREAPRACLSEAAPQGKSLEHWDQRAGASAPHRTPTSTHRMVLSDDPLTTSRSLYCRQAMPRLCPFSVRTNSQVLVLQTCTAVNSAFKSECRKVLPQDTSKQSQNF